MLASFSGREIRLWDPANDRNMRTLEGHSGDFCALCAVKDDDLFLLASGETEVDQVYINRGDVDEDAADYTIRLWNPASGEQVRIFEGHSAPVNSICSFSIRNRYLLASASDDKTVRLWNPMSRAPVLTIPVHYSAKSIMWGNDSLFVGLDNGALAIKLEPSQCSYSA
jgi:WD40 repeat protein